MPLAALGWRAEEACFNAWPSARLMMLDGWLLRAGGGTSRRTNSVNSLRGGPTDPRPILGEASRLYKGLGQELVFRSISLLSGIDQHLDDAGFKPVEAKTLTLFADLNSQKSERLPRVQGDLQPRATPEWLWARASLAGADPAGDAAVKTTLGLISAPARFNLAWGPNGVASIAFGVISRELLVIEAVATAVEHRRQGYACSVVGGLMRWAKDEGALGACLQVLADNENALGLYRALGFETELYSYHYRRLDTAS